MPASAKARLSASPIPLGPPITNPVRPASSRITPPLSGLIISKTSALTIARASGSRSAHCSMDYRLSRCQMTALARTSPSRVEGGRVWNRRNLSVQARLGEGPQTTPSRPRTNPRAPYRCKDWHGRQPSTPAPVAGVANTSDRVPRGVADRGLSPGQTTRRLPLSPARPGAIRIHAFDGIDARRLDEFPSLARDRRGVGRG
jgi:hypothetical protein